MFFTRPYPCKTRMYRYFKNVGLNSHFPFFVVGIQFLSFFLCYYLYQRSSIFLVFFNPTISTILAYNFDSFSIEKLPKWTLELRHWFEGNSSLHPHASERTMTFMLRNKQVEKILRYNNDDRMLGKVWRFRLKMSFSVHRDSSKRLREDSISDVLQ